MNHDQDPRPDWSAFAFDTAAVRAGHRRTAEGEQGEPIFTTSSFVFESAAQAAARFAGNESGNIYSRFTNPTVRTFEERLAALEGGECAVATASGMAAILAVCMGLLRAGDEIVCSRSVFGATALFFQNYLAPFEVVTRFVPLTDLNAWREAITPRTRLLFLETPSNPLGEIADIPALSELAKARGCLLAVDNVYATPALQRPLEQGADLVIHSATKFLDGQGRAVGGAVVGDRETVGKKVFGFLRSAGPTMSPFNAWIFLKGLETLSLRVQRHCDNALQLARWLERQPAVERVYYPGLASHPQHQQAAAQMKAFGGVVAFDVRGGREAAWRLIDQTRFLSITANLGDAKTTITHPATTTHGRLSEEQKMEAGIGEGLVRVSCGLEDIRDIQADLAGGLSELS